MSHLPQNKSRPRWLCQWPTSGTRMPLSPLESISHPEHSDTLASESTLTHICRLSPDKLATYCVRLPTGRMGFTEEKKLRGLLWLRPQWKKVRIADTTLHQQGPRHSASILTKPNSVVASSSQQQKLASWIQTSFNILDLLIHFIVCWMWMILACKGHN